MTVNYRHYSSNKTGLELRPLPILCFLLSVCLCSVGNNSVAEYWNYSPHLEMDVGYDDNLRLIPGESDSGYRATASAELGLARLTEVAKVEGLIGLEAIDYFDTESDGVEDEDIQYLSLYSQYDTNRRNQLGLDLNYRRDFTGTNQVIVNEEIDPDLGLNKRQVRRERVMAAPFWVAKINEVTSIRFDYKYVDVKYDADDLSSLVDYSNQILSTSISKQITNKDALTFSLNAGKYTPDASGSQNNMDSYSSQASIRRTFSKTMDAGLKLGYRYTSYDNNRGDQSDEGAVVRLDAKKRTPSSTLRGVFERKISPSGSGKLIETDMVSLNYIEKLNSLLSFSFNVRFFDNDSFSQGNDNVSNRKVFKVEPGLTRQLTRTWSLGLLYQYSRERRNELSDDAESNAVFISLTYRPLDKTKDKQ